MHLTIAYRDILCNVGKGWFSTRLASEEPALLASYSSVLDLESSRFRDEERMVQSNTISSGEDLQSERVVCFPDCLRGFSRSR